MTGAFETIRYATDGPVATITLARPDAANAQSAQLISELDAAFDPEGQITAREALRALDRLPPAQRRLLLDVALTSPTEVAIALGVSRTTVGIRLAAARAALEELAGGR